MATNVEKDPVTGQYTTGHEWDGIKELNTPLPKWWVYVFYACTLWAIYEWVVMPAWPTADGYTKGIEGYSTRGELAKELAAVKDSRKGWITRFEAASVEQIAADPELRKYAIAGGRAMFAENCAPCHGSGGAGAYGYPTLADDEWIWGGSLADVHQTIAYGVRNTNPQSRQGIMLRFGVDGILTPDQIGTVADYVVALSKGEKGAAAGTELFAQQCAACHGEKGEGMAALGAPALNNGIWLYKGGKDDLVKQIANPKHGDMPAWSERLDAATVKQLAVYVHSLGGGK
ncbi:MAG: cytochrome-c oxidase, cbb3-type subunit III [Alphaproteobacteria bacterium]|nr:cytochrome-c oxidase, cbb3-type subunit III [Alphaproteobacteria bacterium]